MQVDNGAQNIPNPVTDSPILPGFSKEEGTDVRIGPLNSQSETPLSYIDPALPPRSSSDSDRPKHTTTSDSSQPPSLQQPEDGKLTAPGEGDLDASTVAQLPPRGHSKRKGKALAEASTASGKQSDSSTDTATEPQRKKRSKKKSSTSSSYDPAGLAEKMSTTGSSQVEGGSEEQTT